jgi:pyruvate dehydrogenase E1 component alpha subunit
MYRFGPHTTADDPTAYRDDAEVERWREYDPLPRYESYLRDRGLLDDERVAAIAEAVDDRVASLIDAAEEYEPDPPSMFDHALADLPPELRRQRESFEATRAAHGDESFLRD